MCSSWQRRESNLLGAGDVLLLATDGLLEHGGGRFDPDGLERVLAAVQDESAAGTAARVAESLSGFEAHGEGRLRRRVGQG